MSSKFSTNIFCLWWKIPNSEKSIVSFQIPKICLWINLHIFLSMNFQNSIFCQTQEQLIEFCIPYGQGCYWIVIPPTFPDADPWSPDHWVPAALVWIRCTQSPQSPRSPRGGWACPNSGYETPPSRGRRPASWRSASPSQIPVPCVVWKDVQIWRHGLCVCVVNQIIVDRIFLHVTMRSRRNMGFLPWWVTLT